MRPRRRLAELGLRGWVKNLPNGDVEIVAEGPRRELKILAAWANQGPRLARVTGVEEEWSDYRARRALLRSASFAG